MPSEWICESISLVAELPRNPNGKLIRSRLPEVPCVRTNYQPPLASGESLTKRETVEAART
jgi:hypothetical protein